MTSARDIGLLRLAALGLVGPPAVTAAEAVRRLLAVQAQDHPGALTSVALRTVTRTRAAVEEALDAGEVVRSWPLRGTLHLVAAEDLHWLLDLLGRRALNGVAKRWAGLGLDQAQAERARELAVTALSGGRRSSRDDLLRAISRDVDTSGQRGYHLLRYLSQTGTLCLGPTDRLGEQLFVLLDEWVGTRPAIDRDQALAQLALRYFTGHGPATVPDLVRWAGSTTRDARAGLAAVRDRLEAVTLEGTEYYLDPTTPERLAAAGADAGGVLLLPGFDEFVLGYGDRTAVLAAEHADRIVPGRNGVFRPTVVHGGRIVGTWRWTGRGARRTAVAEPFTDLPDDVAAAVPVLAGRLPQEPPATKARATQRRSTTKTGISRSVVRWYSA